MWISTGWLQSRGHQHYSVTSPMSLMPKYAHLQLSPDQRIADATGFGYTWNNFNDLDEAWHASQRDD